MPFYRRFGFFLNFCNFPDSKLVHNVQSEKFFVLHGQCGDTNRQAGGGQLIKPPIARMAAIGIVFRRKLLHKFIVQRGFAIVRFLIRTFGDCKFLRMKGFISFTFEYFPVKLVHSLYCLRFHSCFRIGFFQFSPYFFKFFLFYCIIECHIHILLELKFKLESNFGDYGYSAM